jgi:carboxyl-terminal processing protease
LEKKLSHDLDRDFEYFKKDIKLLLADEIVTRYYYQRGAIVQAIKSDSALYRAQRLLADEAAYREVLTVKEDGKGKKENKRKK